MLGATDRLLRLARELSRIGAWFGGMLVLLAAFVITADVLMRKLFDLTLGGASELSGYVLAISSAWSFAFCLFDRAHIRIDSLYVYLPVRLCALLDIVALAAFTSFAVLMTVQAYAVFQQLAQLWAHSLTPLETPLAVPQALWVAGLVFFVVVMLLLLLRATMALIGGRVATVQTLIGSRTAAQELEEQLSEHV